MRLKISFTITLTQLTPNKQNLAMVAISQSGGTADTPAVLREAKEKNIFTLGIVNVVGSSIARETDAVIYNHKRTGD